MNQPASLRSTWHLDRTNAILSLNGVTGSVDVSHPEKGLLNSKIDQREIEGCVLGVCRSRLPTSSASSVAIPGCDWPVTLADSYVRDNDLVASYHPNDAWPYAPQIYWRADPFSRIESVRTSLAVFVSVQTHLLDTRPAISIRSQLLAVERLSIAIANRGQTEVSPIIEVESLQPAGAALGIIQRLPNLPLSYLEIAPTTDFCELRICQRDGDPMALEWQLFSEFLEKGVIRKARVYAAIVPTAHDIELAVECSMAIEQSPLPLTA